VATTIKVDRLVLLDALTTKLAEQEKLQAEHDKAVEQYEKAEKAWHASVVSAVKKLDVWRVSVRAWSEPVVEIEYKVNLTDLPTQPEKPNYPKGLGGDTEELRKTIRLLSMTTEPNVPASVYKSVSTWL
jgi:hypothetical protein